METAKRMGIFVVVFQEQRLEKYKNKYIIISGKRYIQLKLADNLSLMENCPTSWMLGERFSLMQKAQNKNVRLRILLFIYY